MRAGFSHAGRARALFVLAMLGASASPATVAYAGGFLRDAAVIGGPLTVDGPLVVQGPVTVGGPCTVHGPVRANALIVGGPVYTTLPRGEAPGPAGQEFATPLVIGGPLQVNGPLTIEGTLKVGGPLTSEPPADAERTTESQLDTAPQSPPEETTVPQQSQVLTLPSGGGQRQLVPQPR